MLAKIWNYRAWIADTDPVSLSVFFGRILRNAGFTILREVEHHFEPQGYTKMYLLCESHFALHTFPEEGKTYIELSSCNEMMFDKAVKSIEDKYNVFKE